MEKRWIGVMIIGFLMISTLVCNGQNKQNQEAKEALTDKPDREPSATYRTLHDFTVKDIDGNEFDLATLKGKKVLVVNVASRCGLTPQYEELQKLYSIYQDKGFTLIGFPANNFNGQEPGTNEEIKEFCTGNYGVTFPMMAKISVKGEDMAPLYRWLTQKAENGVMDQEVTWNFQKFMIDEEGRLVDVVMPRESPLSDKIVEWIRQD
ncbi:MAG: Glutathione peroxidase [Proteiniphilum acetatigenes]|uniref:Glutathione peroxidase n=1 Tax=Proteiniphilum acetatigenes TaxID=294710 RepID=A0A101HJX4_9BACT|nr:MAG: Glutathione peroxidase [Proteiniphilum acetatigenes]HCC85255.1 glutathione peroxidase [Porphyromonadaceae bacterium]